MQLDKEAASHNVKVSVPKKMAYESAEVVELKSNAGPSESLFYAYGAGHYLGSSRSFTEALNLAYDKMGVVTDKNQEIVWNRVNRSPARSIKDPENKGALLIRHMDEFSGSMHYDDGILMLDARGCILNQVLDYSWCCDSADNVQFALVLWPQRMVLPPKNLAFSIFHLTH